MASLSSLRAAKKELRTLMKQNLIKISSESINAQTVAVYKAITSFDPYLNANRVGIYLSMPTGELQTDPIVRHALGSGKQVFVPYLHKATNPSPGTPKSVMDMVKLHSLADYESLSRDSWGIPTIDAETVSEREHILGEIAIEGCGKLDMILMPGVAFEKDLGNASIKRLGHGKGFYDFFLHRYSEGRGTAAKELALGPGTDALLYGLALEEQELGSELSVPVGEYDHRLHGLFVGNGQLVDGHTNIA
ncbi:hypothetical protein BJ875DRAFT_288353 [Amylocarpus encephaloides]|uniref:5-formyltetrahydrofolate cyclo-ligase n=1 Tax=Amylocarpus encephaloides TaxID=45428 RepID=A0A9P8C668_9HELO|nr:hypothetical protein BJ875DRAFT_288353 [Amylocarpus encephaloides]